jgi:hypothetical protein
MAKRSKKVKVSPGRKKKASRMDRKLTKPDQPARRSPRSQVLPGMEQVRSKPLDNLCEGLADVRAAINSNKQEESGLIQSALQTMVRRNIQVYKHGGIELARVPGAEKLRVRVIKEQGDADASNLQQADEEVAEEVAHGGEVEVETAGAEGITH